MAAPTSISGTGIHDALLTPLPSASADRRVILTFEDHLLRRFGTAEIIRLDQGETFQVVRGMADEIWALLDGVAEFELEDTRPDSPTLGASQSIRMDSPARLLVPFGVRLLVRPTSQSLLLRLMSHSEREDPPLPVKA
jgi:hypothetical protein